MEISIRPYRNTDLNELILLMDELGYPLDRHDLQGNIEMIFKREGAILVAEKESQIIASICAITDVRLAEGVYGEIVSLIVSKDYRNMGVGRKLVAEAEKWLGKYVGKIRVRANTVRGDAHKFYERQGYTEIKSQKLFKKDLACKKNSS